MSIEDPARRLDNLPIAPASQFSRLRANFGVVSQLLDVPEYSLYNQLCCWWIVQGDVVSDGIEIAKRRLCPDYFSHRAIRRLA